MLQLSNTPKHHSVTLKSIQNNIIHVATSSFSMTVTQHIHTCNAFKLHSYCYIKKPNVANCIAIIIQTMIYVILYRGVDRKFKRGFPLMVE